MSRQRLPTPEGPTELGSLDGLAYSLWQPRDEPRGGLVVIHGADSCKENHHDMARAARDAGFTAVAYDQRGHGASEGDLDERWLDDVATIATLLPRPLALRGTSMGGTVALLAAERVGASAVVAVCPASPQLLLAGLRHDAFGFRVDRARVEPLLASTDLDRAVEGYSGALMLQHAEGDERVPVAGTIALHGLARAARAKQLIVVPGGHHRSIQHDAELQGVVVAVHRAGVRGAVSAPWWRSAVVYQIYPRSFADSDGDGVGDLRGITQRLEYVRDLGADAVWLSPIYRSPMADYGYDVSDHCDIDPLFGTLADADALIERAHRLGLRVLFDLVASHTSDEHPWFVESRAARDSPKRDWYVWRDAGEEPPNGWQSSFGDRAPAWTRDAATGEWYLHSFLPQQPDLNWDEPAVEAAMHDVMRFWLRRGVDGFRIDATHRMGKDPALGENERSLRHDQDWAATIHPRLARIRRVLEEFDGDRVAVGEVTVYDQGRLAAYVAGGDELHLAHNFVFFGQPWSAARFRAAVDEFEQLAGDAAWPAWCLNNHDKSRTATRYGPTRARVAALLVLTLRGTPFLYQGEELGLTDGWIPPAAVVDVAGRDPERVPMPWTPGPGAGFTTGDPWLPLHPDADRLAASTQATDPSSTLSFYRALLTLRRAEPALHAGSYRSIDAAPDVFAYIREHAGRRLLIALNFAPFPRPLPDEARSARVLLTTLHAQPTQESGLARFFHRCTRNQRKKGARPFLAWG